MEKFGSPFPVAKIDAKNKTDVDFMKAALAEAVKIGGMVVDHSAEVQLIAAAAAANGQAYENFLDVCNREISKIILGQTLSATVEPTGLGASTGNLHSDVREDYRKFDRLRLGECLQKQIFTQFLKINAIKGHAPSIIWGGLSQEEAAAAGTLLVSLNSAGLQPTDDALPSISEKMGFPIERKAMPEKPPSAPLEKLSAGKGNGDLQIFKSRDDWRELNRKRSNRGFQKKYRTKYPGWELYRASESKVPRDWHERWMKAGNATGRKIGDGWTLDGERMIAFKHHPIWEQLGSRSLFEDATQQDFPPFAFNSGMACRGVGQKECDALLSETDEEEEDAVK